MPMNVRSAKDFFRPLAVGAPEPLREIPARPSRAIHFFDPSNEKMAAKIPQLVGTVDVLLGNLEDAILETARGVANVEEICGASPRMQGLSLGPADLAADRRMKTTRVGGGHPGYLVRQDPSKTSDGVDSTDRATYQQDLWHY